MSGHGGIAISKNGNGRTNGYFIPDGIPVTGNNRLWFSLFYTTKIYKNIIMFYFYVCFLREVTEEFLPERCKMTFTDCCNVGRFVIGPKALLFASCGRFQTSDTAYNPKIDKMGSVFTDILWCSTLDIVKQLKQKLLDICINTFLCTNMIKN
jgi:hypothetical protein